MRFKKLVQTCMEDGIIIGVVAVGNEELDDDDRDEKALERR
jgi:Lon protease-like protein